MDSGTEHNFDIRFRLVRGRTEGIGRPLEFKAVVNSTSEELDTGDNKWEASVQIIKKAELELVGTSDPQVVWFGGEVRDLLSIGRNLSLDKRCFIDGSRRGYWSYG